MALIAARMVYDIGFSEDGMFDLDATFGVPTHTVSATPLGNAVKHFACHEISRHASGSPRNRGLAPSG